MPATLVGLARPLRAKQRQGCISRNHYYIGQGYFREVKGVGFQGFVDVYEKARNDQETWHEES